jgi:tetratricopeptide (TPR) repeat protein
MQQLQQVFGMYTAGQFAQALAAAENLERECGEHPVLLVLMGAIHTAMLDHDAAISRFQKAIQLAPEIADNHFHLGNAFFEKGDLTAALACYQKAVELKADHVDAHNKLCQALERSNQVDDFAAALANAKEHCPNGHPGLKLREAELLKRNKDFAAARACLEGSAWQSGDLETQEAAAYLLCDLCDRLDDPDAAFGYAQEANRICAGGLPARRTDRSAYFRLIDELGEAFSAEKVSNWPEFTAGDDYTAPVFLVGFPRSGTTLLNTILQSHSRIAVTEEAPTVYALESALREMAGGVLGDLAGLDDGQVQALRQAYFDELGNHVGPSISRHWSSTSCP